MSDETNELTFHITITSFYPPLASCQIYRVDITYNKIYQGYFDFCHSKEENEFKGVRQRVEGNKWTYVEDWYPTFTDYLYSIRGHLFDVQYRKEEYSMESLRYAIEKAWESLEKK